MGVFMEHDRLRRWTVAGQVCGHESARTLERGNIETGNRRAASAARIEFSQVAHTRHQIDGDAVSTRRTRFRMVGDQPQRAVIALEPLRIFATLEDRKSVVTGKRVSVRVDLGGSRIIKKQYQS